MDSVSTNVTNSISPNVTSTVSINSDNKTPRYKMSCYILGTFLLIQSPLFAIIMQGIGQNKKILAH